MKLWIAWQNCKLRGRTWLLIEIIESHLPMVVDADLRLSLMGMLIDMVHLSGDYRKA